MSCVAPAPYTGQPAPQSYDACRLLTNAAQQASLAAEPKDTSWLMWQVVVGPAQAAGLAYDDLSPSASAKACSDAGDCPGAAKHHAVARDAHRAMALAILYKRSPGTDADVIAHRAAGDAHDAAHQAHAKYGPGEGLTQ